MPPRPKARCVFLWKKTNYRRVSKGKVWQNLIFGCVLCSSPYENVTSGLTPMVSLSRPLQIRCQCLAGPHRSPDETWETP